MKEGAMMNNPELWAVFFRYFLVPFLIGCAALALWEFIAERRANLD